MLEQRVTNLTFAQKLGDWWCRTIHDAPMWPIHERYQCRKCGRVHPVPWAARPVIASSARANKPALQALPTR
jgi:hypothetical protein